MPESVFFGAVITAKRPTPYVPRPLSPEDGSEMLHIAQVSIPATAAVPTGTRVSLLLSVEGGPADFCVATMAVGSSDTISLDLNLEGYCEFSVVGHKAAVVHVSGYYVPTDNDDDEEISDAGDEYDEELKSMSREELEALLAGGDEDDDDEDDDDESDDEDEMPGVTRTKHTTIEEIKASMPNGKAAKGKQAPAEEDSDDDEDEDDDEDDDDEEEEGSDEDGSVDDEELAQLALEIEEAEKKLEAEAAAKQASTPKRKRDAAPAAATPEGADKKKLKSQVFSNGFEVHRVKDSVNPQAMQAKPGKKVTVRYKGTLKNGKVFDETKGNKTFQFRLGVGEVIKGWDKGVAGMRVGDKRKLIVPPEMAYGSSGVKGLIPGGSVLTFDVELLAVK